MEDFIMTQHETETSDAVPSQPASPQGKLLSKTLARLDAFFPRPRHPTTPGESPAASTPGEGDHPVRHSPPGRGPLFGR